jgi:hypothetical protein
MPVADQARGALRRRNEGAVIAIAVSQFEPGKRLRTPFEFISGDPPESYTDAAIPALAPFLVEIAPTRRMAIGCRHKSRDRRAKAAASRSDGEDRQARC